ncbi:MAG: transporter substrate-binding domain-containing protein [Pseudomonadota bacterium]
MRPILTMAGRSALGGALLAAALTAAGAGAAPLVLMTEDYPPFNMRDKDGRVAGLSTDIVRALMREAGQQYSLEMMPWARAMEKARMLPGHCVFSMSRLDNREKQFSWIGPIATNDFTLFTKGQPGKRLRSLKDIKGARIGSYLGDGGVAYLRNQGFKVDVAPRDDLNPRKLMIGRIDYWATGKLSGQYLLSNQKVRGVVPVLTMEHGSMYLACHRALDGERVRVMNEALGRLRKNGKVARIYARYGYTP